MLWQRRSKYDHHFEVPGHCTDVFPVVLVSGFGGQGSGNGALSEAIQKCCLALGDHFEDDFQDTVSSPHLNFRISNDNMAPVTYSGSCACGRISFKASVEVLSVTWCFCITCQKQSGAPFLPFADFKKEDITWSQQPDVWASSNIAERYFCKQCGSSMAMLYYHEPDRVGVAICSIDAGSRLGLVPESHIFLKDKPDWFQLPDDGAERCEEFPSGYEGPTPLEKGSKVAEGSV